MTLASLFLTLLSLFLTLLSLFQVPLEISATSWYFYYLPWCLPHTTQLISHLLHNFCFLFFHLHFFYLKLLRCHLFGGSFYSFACSCSYPRFPYFYPFCHVLTSNFQTLAFLNRFFCLYCKLTHYLLSSAYYFVLLWFDNRCCVGYAQRTGSVKCVILYILILLYDNDFSRPICRANWQYVSLAIL